ncbi:MAG: hypothetical protein Q4D38_09380 [Planctomycetia bacterium]|nr:hypothetical protein [Planctomycetia bacterium]
MMKNQLYLSCFGNSVSRDAFWIEACRFRSNRLVGVLRGVAVAIIFFLINIPSWGSDTPFPLTDLSDIAGSEITTLDAPPLEEIAQADTQTNTQTETSTPRRPAAAENAQTPAAADNTMLLEAVSFNGIVPGESTFKEMVEKFGKPTAYSKDAGGAGIDFAEFHVDGFKGIGAHVTKGVIEAVIVEVAQVTGARILAKELQIENYQSVFIAAENGDIVGEIFPDIGISFAYDPKGKLGNVADFSNSDAEIPTNVIQIVFQPHSAGAFLMRAQTILESDPAGALRDVEKALLLDPKNAEALAMKKTLAASAVPQSPQTPQTPQAPTKPEEMVAQPETPDQPEAPAQLESVAEDSFPPLPDAPGATSESATDMPSSVTPDVTPEITPDETAESLPTSTTLPELPELPSDLPGTLPDTLPAAAPESDVSKPELPEELLDDLDALSKPDTTSRNEEFSFEDALFQQTEKLTRRKQYTHAFDMLEEIRKRFAENPFVQIRADLVEGDVWMVLAEPNPVEAYKFHYRAVLEGESLLSQGKTTAGREITIRSRERQFLLEILMDAHLGIAADLAAGSWAKKASRVEEHLTRAQEVSETFLEQSVSGDFQTHDRRHGIALRSLAVCILVGKEINPEKYAARLIQSSHKRLEIAASTEDYCRTCYETSLALDDAARICFQRSEEEKAKAYLKRSITMMEMVKKLKGGEITPLEHFLLAQLYYDMGQSFARPAHALTNAAQRKAAYRRATEWYEKAIPCLTEVIRSKEWGDVLRLSDIANGMSIAYWEVGQEKRTLSLLKTGIFCLERYVKEHPSEKSRLKIPYENIIRVLDFMGDKPQKETYAQKLRALE